MTQTILWDVASDAPVDWVSQFPEYDPIILQLLYNRGWHTVEQIESFLSPDYSRDVYDPMLFSQMRYACKRVWQAIDDGEKILIFGDYDADGVCSSVLLSDFLSQQGAQVTVILPHRIKDGYGLNAKVLPRILEQAPQLVITVDCGSTNVAEIQTLREHNIDTVVIDHHHEPEEKPAAFAVLNCQFADAGYPNTALAAVGMVFKTVQGMIAYRRETNADFDYRTGREKWYLDLVAIATVADCVQLTLENRALVHFGLMVLNKTVRPGLRALVEQTGLEWGKINERHIGFVIAPRINAAGRMSHADAVFELLAVSQSGAEATEKAIQVHEENSARQRVTEQYIKVAEAQIQDALERGDSLLSVYVPDWNIGLVGLVAGRLTEKYQRPSLVMTMVDGVIKGSGRSIEGYHITKALGSVSSFLTRYGGHAQACGFTLQASSKQQSFVTAMVAHAAESIDSKQVAHKRIRVDAVVPLAAITWELYEYLAAFAPYGEGNPPPVLATRGVEIKYLRLVGAQSQHLKCTVASQQGVFRKGIAFGMGAIQGVELSDGDVVDIVYTVEVNQWNGNRELQLIIKDIQISNQTS